MGSRSIEKILKGKSHLKFLLKAEKLLPENKRRKEELEWFEINEPKLVAKLRKEI